MVHMTRIVDAQPLVQGVAIRVFQRRDGEMRALALSEFAGGTDGADDACRLVRVLATAHHHGGIAAGHVTGGKDAAGTGAGIEGLAADLRKQLCELACGDGLAGFIDRLLAAIQEGGGERAGLDVDGDFTFAFDDLGYDLAGFQAAVTQRAAGFFWKNSSSEK